MTCWYKKRMPHYKWKKNLLTGRTNNDKKLNVRESFQALILTKAYKIYCDVRIAKIGRRKSKKTTTVLAIWKIHNLLILERKVPLIARWKANPRLKESSITLRLIYAHLHFISHYMPTCQQDTHHHHHSP